MYICIMNKGTTVTFREEHLLETNTLKWLQLKVDSGEHRTLAAAITVLCVKAYKKEHKIK